MDVMYTKWGTQPLQNCWGAYHRQEREMLEMSDQGIPTKVIAEYYLGSIKDIQRSLKRTREELIHRDFWLREITLQEIQKARGQDLFFSISLRAIANTYMTYLDDIKNYD